MPHQETLTVLAEIREGQVETLRRLLGSIREHNGNWDVLPFRNMPRLHFANLAIFDATQDLDGNSIPAQLALLTHVDAPLDAHLNDLADIGGTGLDTLFGHCKDYPDRADRSPPARVRFLRQHSYPSVAVHVNRRGRSVEQILQEHGLRGELDRFLDAGKFDGLAPQEIKQRVVDFVKGRADLRWALQPPAPPAWSWRLREWAHRVFGILLAIVLAPLLLLGLPLFLWLLRRHEKSDRPSTESVAPEVARAFRDDEDYWMHNQVIAAGLFKPGLFRKLTTRLILALADYSTRHIYNRGTLSGLNTIHFARWVTLDGGRRLFFASNYDGSLESYMDDFIDKAAWGLNAIFSNGDGFPRTAFLFCRGITDEKAYKRFLPTRQVQSNVWFSAYPHLTTKNIANNEAIRHGLSETMDEEGTRRWLKRFGRGNQLPESGWIARKLDRLRWDKICRNCN